MLFIIKCITSLSTHFISFQLELHIKFAINIKLLLMHISFLWPNTSIETSNWRRARAIFATIVTSSAKNDNFVFNGKCAMGRSCDFHVRRLKVKKRFNANLLTIILEWKGDRFDSYSIIASQINDLTILSGNAGTTNQFIN